MFKTELEIVKFDVEDIITTSSGLTDGGEGGEGSNNNPMEFSLRGKTNINN